MSSCAHAIAMNFQLVPIIQPEIPAILQWCKDCGAIRNIKGTQISEWIQTTQNLNIESDDGR